MPVAKESSDFTPAPAGTHVARCFGCVSLGTQHSDLYADSFRLLLMFELPFETKQIDGKAVPLTCQKEYTLSLGKKSTLRKHLDSWRGRPFTKEELEGFEVSKVVGAPCQLTIVHEQSQKGSTYARIEAITGLAKGMTCPEQYHKSVKYEVEEGNAEVSETFKALPEWIRKKIEQCGEWSVGATQPAASEPSQPEVPEDDVPF